MTSLPARSNPGSARAKGAGSAGTEGEGSELSVIAAALHMALSDLKSGLAAGKSLAQIATSAGIDPNKLIATVVDDATSKINAAVSAGALSRAQADKIIAMLPGLVSDVVNHSFGDIGAGFAPGSQLPARLGSLGKLAHLGDFAKMGNMHDLPGMGKLDGTGDFKSFFSNMFGSFGNLGQAKPGANIDPQALISSIVSMATDAVNAASSAGLLTQAQASTILAGLTPAITNLVHTILDASSNLENQAAGWASLGSSWMAQLHH
jgi:urease accessory protein UreF